MGEHENFQASAHRRTRRRQEPNDFDTLLPIQYYDRVVGGNPLSGELRLFFAILEDALRCYVLAKNARSGTKRAEFVDARKWFFSRGMLNVFSFESVCAALGLNPECLRRRLESIAPSDLPMKQFHTRRRRLARLPARKRRVMSLATALTNGHDHSDGEPLPDGHLTNGKSSAAAHEISINGSSEEQCLSPEVHRAANGHASNGASVAIQEHDDSGPEIAEALPGPRDPAANANEVMAGK
jgi:hypothetical protein